MNNAGSYLVPFAFGLLVAGLILGYQMGFWVVVVCAVVFYFLLTFVNSIDREGIEIRKKR